MRKKILLGIAALFTALLIAELIFRIAGYSPHKKRNYSFYSVPRNCYIPDPLLGSSLGEGSFKATVNEKLTYGTNHVITGPDVTRKIYNTLPDWGLPRIDFHGCSFTYGMGVNDTQTYSYQFARDDSRFNVVNYGCPGYATLQALLILKRQVAQNSLPKVVVINYLDFHEERNAGTAQWREGLQEGFLMLDNRFLSNDLLSRIDSCRFPFASILNDQLQIKWSNVHQLYVRLFGRDQSALIYMAEKALNRSLFDRSSPCLTTEAIITEIQKICKEHGIALIVTTMSGGEETKRIARFLAEKHIQNIDLGIDFSNPAYTNQPYDGHPSPLAHRLFAEKLIQAGIAAPVQ